jgi:hypothetical protein
MMTVHKRAKELHEKMPDLVLREPARLFACALGVTGGSPDKGGQVAAAAILHDHVEDTLVAVHMAVVVAHYVLVVQVFEDVHLRYDLPPVPLGHEREGEVFPGEDLIQQIRNQMRSRKQGGERASMQTKASGRRRMTQRERQPSAIATRCERIARTAPSDFLLTFRMTPKEPFPITSKHSNWSSQAVVDADAIVQRAMVELTENNT